MVSADDQREQRVREAVAVIDRLFLLRADGIDVGSVVIADALADAGLLATPELLAEERAKALEWATDQLHARYGVPMVDEAARIRRGVGADA